MIVVFGNEKFYIKKNKDAVSKLQAEEMNKEKYRLTFQSMTTREKSLVTGEQWTGYLENYKKNLDELSEKLKSDLQPSQPSYSPKDDPWDFIDRVGWGTTTRAKRRGSKEEEKEETPKEAPEEDVEFKSLCEAAYNFRTHSMQE